MADYHHDTVIAGHKSWLGPLQPEGLVVSSTVMAEAQVILPDPNPEQQRDFCTHIAKRSELPAAPADLDAESAEQLCIKNVPAFLQDFLGWPADLVHGLDPARPIPESLHVPLPELGVELFPSLALADPKPSDPARAWLVLVKILPVGTDLDAAPDDDWSATESQRFERLLWETAVTLGIVTDGRVIRLISYPKGESPGSLSFPVSFMTEVPGRRVLAGLHLLLSAYRLLSAPTAARLHTLCARSRDFQATVSTTLAGQVIDAAFELVRGLQSAHEHSHQKLLADVLADRPNEVYEGMLTVLMRLVFTLYAEDKGLFPTTSLYVQDYGVHGLFERLRTDAARHPDTMDERFGAWQQLLALFRMIHSGSRHPQIEMPARFGYLFDPDRFPWLEGRPHASSVATTATLPAVPDGTIWRVLEKLLVLDGERLSYRTLDVEQIGSVYEVMMGFGIGIADGPSITARPKKKHGAPVPVNLDALLASPSAERVKWLEAKTDHKLQGNRADALKAARTTDDVLAVLDAAKKIQRSATPHPLSKGAMLLVPSDERRRSGSNYTPRKLTGPIVRKTLEPILANLGSKPTPQQILDLKVCDPAMGSGAFLVEACRQLAEHLVVAWERHGGKPAARKDRGEDEILLARRLVAQKCLYGVDKNPMAADLAKLSLWLATLAKDQPFTFLDHSLRSGDSLVGLGTKQISSLHWEPQKQLPLVADRLAKAIDRANASRREILNAGDFLSPQLKSQKLEVADDALSSARLIGDAVIACFFAADKATKRTLALKQLALVVDPFVKGTGDYATQRLILQDLVNWLRGKPRDPAIAARTDALAPREPISHPLVPFHWEIEFPEVFGRENPGFDAIVGNPPFLGGKKISPAHGENYRDWLATTHTDSSSNGDIVAHFFQRSFGKLCEAGCFGLIATNTISQGDTRATGLRPIRKAGAVIYSATRRLRWPGEAAVVVSVVHCCRGLCNVAYDLDGLSVPRITAFLTSDGDDDDPRRLIANKSRCFIGVLVHGLGFVFEEEPDAEGNTLVEMQRLLSASPANADRIRPYLGGEDINTSPTHEACRFVIDFGEMSEKEASGWPALLDLVRAKVLPKRLKSKNDRIKRDWWLFEYRAEELRTLTSTLPNYMVCARVSQWHAPTFIPTGPIVNEKIVAFPTISTAFYSVVQSRSHEIWAYSFSSTLEDRLNYTPTDCFETFPFPENFETDPALEAVGRTYYEFRAALMVKNDEGLTKTYNRFHDPGEPSKEIAELRLLHAEMDRAVLAAYDWSDVPTACGFALDWLDLDDEELAETLAAAPDDVRERIESADYFFPDAATACRFQTHIKQSGRAKLPWRYRWPDDVRDDVLARLLALNAKRAEAERLAGLTPPPPGPDGDSLKPIGKPHPPPPEKTPTKKSAPRANRKSTDHPLFGEHH